MAKKSIMETNLEVAVQWHPYKNPHADAIEGEYAPGSQKCPYNFTPGSENPSWWLCPDVTCSEGCSHEWPASIYNRCKAKPTGCPFCSKPKKKFCIHESLPYTHPERAKQWHPYKNLHGDAIEGEYAPGNQQSPYSFTYGSSEEKWWMCPSTCPEGCPHEWPASICEVASGNGCPICINRQVACIHQSIVYTDPELASQWHPTKNGDLKPESVTRRCNIPVWWLFETGCSEGCTHEVYMQINSKSIGGKYRCIHQSIAHTHPEIAIELHPTLNGDLRPENLTYGSNERPWWLCEKGHYWRSSVSNRCRLGRGCSKCCNSRGYSVVACEWIDSLSSSICTFVQHEENVGEYRIPEMPGSETDGFITCYMDYNRIALEFHGCVWHGCPTCKDHSANNHLGQSFAELYEKTNERTTKLRAHGYIVIEIWECEYAKLKVNVDWKKWFEHKLSEQIL